MGALRRKADGRLVYLPSQLVVGRSEACDLVLEVASVSSNHAVIRFREPRWVVSDLGSRNGTYLNGRRVGATSQSVSEVNIGDELAFAERNEIWILVDDSAPGPALIPLDGTPPIPLREGELLAIPSEDEALGYFYREGVSWKFEDLSGLVQSVHAGQVFGVGGLELRLFVPAPAPETPAAADPVTERSFDAASFDIRVAVNEEAAALEIDICGDAVTLPSRAHWYLLAYLARQRLKQHASSSADPQPGEGGWVTVEQACRDLCVASAEALAVVVYRCRKDLERIGFKESSRLIDRTQRGLLRIGVPAERLRIGPLR